MNGLLVTADAFNLLNWNFYPANNIGQALSFHLLDKSISGLRFLICRNS
jgi:hypothetical protein